MSNNIKMKYEEPTTDIILFETADIITASENGWEGEDESLIEEEEQT